MPSQLTPTEQFAALCVLDALYDFVAASPLSVFSQEQVLALIEAVRTNDAVFDDDVITAQMIVTATFAPIAS